MNRLTPGTNLENTMTKPEDKFYKFYLINGAHLAYLERLVNRLNRAEPFERNPGHPWNQREVQKNLGEIVIRETKEREVDFFL